MSKFLSLRVDDDLLSDIEAAALSSGLTRSEWVISALNEALERDTAEVRLGKLVGRIEDIVNAAPTRPVGHSKPLREQAKQTHRKVNKAAPVASGEGGYQPTEAELVIIELCQSGMSNVEIAGHLNEKGFTTIKGLSWDNLKVRDSKSRLKSRGLTV